MRNIFLNLHYNFHNSFYQLYILVHNLHFYLENNYLLNILYKDCLKDDILHNFLDMEYKSKQAVKFIEDGNKVRLSIRMKGRQQAHPEISMKIACKPSCIPYGNRIVKAHAFTVSFYLLGCCFGTKLWYCSIPRYDLENEEHQKGYYKQCYDHAYSLFNKVFHL